MAMSKKEALKGAVVTGMSDKTGRHDPLAEMARIGQLAAAERAAKKQAQDPGRCCARCKTPYGCGNPPCACHNPTEAAKSLRTVGGLYDLIAAVVETENPRPIR